MIEYLGRAAAAFALSLPALHTCAQGVDAGIRRPALIACEQPKWTNEALRYELEGATVVQYDVDDAGLPSSVRVLRGSGWAVLDQMALRAMATCRFEPPADANVVRARLQTSYDWKLEDAGPKPVPAALVAGSCAPSDQIGAFQPFDGKVPRRSNGILVRFLLDPEGKPFGIKVEETHPAPVSVASAFIQSCRFSPATMDGKPVPGNLSGWLTLK